LPPAARNDGHRGSDRRFLLLSLSALGVVYGDIGTSPIYACVNVFTAHIRSADPRQRSWRTVAHLLGAHDHYLAEVPALRNEGRQPRRRWHPGAAGIACPWRDRSRKSRLLLFVGLFGAALLYGDGAITPAISVLSAVEGLEIAAPGLKPFVLPITIAVLMLLFRIQKSGSTRIGSVFGPVMLLWFATLALLGISWIVRAPQVLAAVNPAHGVDFFLHNGWRGFVVLGAVFLVVTGGEALYADMGHFGRFPIRLAWFALVLPALLLNYSARRPDPAQPRTGAPTVLQPGAGVALYPWSCSLPLPPSLPRRRSYPEHFPSPGRLSSSGSAPMST